MSDKAIDERISHVAGHIDLGGGNIIRSPHFRGQLVFSVGGALPPCSYVPGTDLAHFILHDSSLRNATFKSTLIDYPGLTDTIRTFYSILSPEYNITFLKLIVLAIHDTLLSTRYHSSTTEKTVILFYIERVGLRFYRPGWSEDAYLGQPVNIYRYAIISGFCMNFAQAVPRIVMSRDVSAKWPKKLGYFSKNVPSTIFLA